MKWIGILVFITLFTGVFVGGYYYILSRLFTLFNIKKTLFFWVLLLLLSFGYVLFSILERVFPCFLCQLLLRFSAIGLGVGLLSLIVLPVHDLLLWMFKFSTSVSRWGLVGMILFLTIYSIINAMRLEIKRIELTGPVDTKLVQLSDIHRGSVSERHLKRLIEQTNQLDPDLILITGDLIDPAEDLTDNSLKILEEFKAPVYWVSGNHERLAGMKSVIRMIEQTSVIPLRNETTQIGNIQLIGIDDSRNRKQVEQVLTGIDVDPDCYSILMYHQPEGCNAAAKAGIDLMLCGHTHNGQIWPFNWVVRSRFKYLCSLYEIDGMKLYVSPGSGTWSPPMRLGSRNQVTMIQLRKDS